MPTPNEGESKSAYIARAVREIMGEGKTQDQALGQAYGMWRQAHGGKKPKAKLFKEYYGDDPEDDYEPPDADEETEADGPEDGDGDSCDEWEGEDQLIDDLNFPVEASYREPGGALVARSGTFGVGTFTNYKRASLFKDVGVQGVHAETALGNEEEADRKAKEQAEADAVHASKRDGWKLPFKITKTDNDKRQIFGWAYVSEDGGKLIVDKQGDIIPIEELEKAAYDYLLESREGGEMHERGGLMHTIESVVYTPEKSAIGVKHDSGRYGWWVGFQVQDEDLWKRLKKGDLLELSIGGESMMQHVESVETYQANKDLFKARGRRHARLPFRY